MLKMVNIVTYGRSGSTLLMNLLNSIPGYCIRGENHMIFRTLIEFVSAAQHLQNSTSGVRYRPRGPWNNRIEMAGLTQRVGDLIHHVLDPEATARVIGFKEIRYVHLPPAALTDYLDRFHDVTACRYVVLTRRFQDVIKSGWWPNQKENARRLIPRFEQAMREYGKCRPSSVFDITYEDVTGPRKRLRELFAWLGEEFDPVRLNPVFAVRYS